MHRNFLFLRQFDVSPVIPRLLKSNPESWPGLAARGETGNPLIGLGASVVLRGHDNITEENWLDDLPVKDVGTLEEWPTMKRLLGEARDTIMAHPIGQQYLSGIPGRAMISRLDPGATIFWHDDNGPYHQRNVRFHIPLITNLKCLSYAQEEVIHMPAGCLHWFNNRVRHSSANFGDSYRYHVIFEMRRKGT